MFAILILSEIILLYNNEPNVKSDKNKIDRNFYFEDNLY